MYRVQSKAHYVTKRKISEHQGLIDEPRLMSMCICHWNSGVCRFLYEVRQALQGHLDAQVAWRKSYPDGRLSVY